MNVESDPTNWIDPSGLSAAVANTMMEIDLGGGGGAIDMGPAGAALTTAVAVDLVVESRQKGERNQTARPDGTDNPFKHMKPDPNDPNRVERKDLHTGKKDSQKMPDGFKDWWNKKHPKNRCP